MSEFPTALSPSSPAPSTTTTTSAATTTESSSTTHFDNEAYYNSLSPSEGQTWVIISIGVVRECYQI